MKKTVLREYAKLIAKTGVNVQKGQEVFIQAELDQPEFVAMVVDECYKLKAKKVVVDWSYQPLTKLHVRYRSLKTLSTLDNYEEARWQHYVDTIPCRIYLISEDPDGLRGVNQEKMARSSRPSTPSSRATATRSKTNTSGASRRAGRKVGQEALPGAARVAGRGKAVGRHFEDLARNGRSHPAWNDHNKDLNDRCEYLNNLHIRNCATSPPTAPTSPSA